MKSHPLCRSVLGPVLACVMLAACQTAPLPTTEDETQGRLTRPAPKPASPGAGVAPNPANNPAGGFDTSPTAASMAEDGRWQHEATVSADAGGVIVSPDGFMKLQIPPGALDRDTVIRMNWFDTSTMTVTDEAGRKGDPGISGQVDLGGARIKDGAQILVTAPVDPRFVARVKMDDGSYNPEKYGLNQNNDGVWSLTMPIKGANPNPEPDDATAPNDSLAWEFNLQALPVPQDELVDPAKLTGDPELDKARKANYKVQCTFTTIPWNNSKVQEVNSLEGRYPSKFDCYTRPNNGDGSHTLHCFICAAVYGNQTKCEAIRTCWGSANLGEAGCSTPAPQPTPTPTPVCEVRAKVSWSSDDTQLHGKPAAQHAYVRFEGLSGGGTEDKALNGSGEAGKRYEEGTRIRLTPYASRPAIVGAARTLTHDCPSGNQSFTLTKNRPTIHFAGRNEGGTKNADVQVLTNRGTFSNAALIFSSKVSIYPEPEQAPVNVGNNTYQQGAAWVDINPNGAGVNAKWNSSHALYYKAWFSSQVKANFTYQSNDATVPADQQPSVKWHGQPATNLDITFAHPVSSAAGKQPGRDQLSFPNHGTANAVAWGLNRANGSVTGTRQANGVTASGQSSYLVGDTTAVGVVAQLPKLKLKLKGDFPANNTSPFVLFYKLKRQDQATYVNKEMTLPAPGADGTITVSLPIEEPVGSLFKHDFEIRSIYTRDQLYNVIQPDAGWPSTRKAAFRNGELVYPEMMAIGITPKYRTR